MDDCAASQKLKACATDEDKCASLQEMYQGRMQYHKFCLHETINCKEVCTKYSSNGRKCSDKDIVCIFLSFFLSLFYVYLLFGFYLLPSTALSCNYEIQTLTFP